eukprot:CAMPEP_0171326622 /NCGR_PEP_ID=MMETSP0816-20121228/117570_1 /TAXON_ID=420281 /ORGANISM="Proboscia inermis, Strain CCAP1064/1" /LENGTH=258 /DNA_ID=CAMNT_0011826141 /DNA_START=307 /DNA_END=1084 /DNA_ORIENTATION=+
MKIFHEGVLFATFDVIIGLFDAKIMKDLETLSYQINLCRDMLKTSGDPANREALLETIEYLEACAPRMVELVEAAAQGALKEEATLMKCLEMNDVLVKILADCDNPDKLAEFAVESVSTGVAKAASTYVDSLDLDDLLLDSSSTTDNSKPLSTDGRQFKSDDPFSSSTDGRQFKSDDPFEKLKSDDPFGLSADERPFKSDDPFGSSTDGKQFKSDDPFGLSTDVLTAKPDFIGKSSEDDGGGKAGPDDFDVFIKGRTS